LGLGLIAVLLYCCNKEKAKVAYDRLTAPEVQFQDGREQRFSNLRY